MNMTITGLKLVNSLLIITIALVEMFDTFIENFLLFFLELNI